MRVLRDPVVSRQAAIEIACFDPGRDRASRGARDRPRGAGSGLLRPRSFRRTAQSREADDSRHRRAHRGSRANCRAGSPALPVPVLAQRSTHRGRSSRPVWPTSTSPCSTPPVACCARCAATGTAERFLERIGTIRQLEPGAAFRSSFILGYPGETEEDHDELLRFLEEADLDWAGFFTFSSEEGTLADGLGEQVPGRACARATARVLRAAGGDHGASAPGALSGRPARCSSTRPAGRGRTGRRPRSTASMRVPASVPQGWLGSVRVVGGERAGPARRRPWPPSARLATGPMKLRESTFGPSALVTPANMLTLARLLASPLMVLLVDRDRPLELVARRACGLSARRSDGLDGVLARRQGADAFGSVPRPARRQVPRPRRAGGAGGHRRDRLAPVILIAAREISMSVFRGYAGRHGRLGPSPNLGEGEDPGCRTS